MSYLHHKQQSRFTIAEQRRRWEVEYSKGHVIPSTTRSQPSKILLAAAPFLRIAPGTRAIDVGCGPGRNAVWLAGQGCVVCAVDFCDAAIAITTRAAQSAVAGERISVHNLLVDPPLPFKSGAFQLAIDSYFFCHIDDTDLKVRYRSELQRLLAPGGMLFVSVFLPNDEYYAPMIESDTENPIVVDPHNGILKQLYSQQAIEAFFENGFERLLTIRLDFNDVVVNRSFRRRILGLVLQKSDGQKA